MDGERGEGPELEKQFEVTGHPTFILLNKDGAVVDRWRGYGKADKFIENLMAGVQDPTTIDQKRKRFASKPTVGDAEKLANFHGAREEYKDAVRYYGEAQKLAGGTRDFTYPLFDATADGVIEGAFTLTDAKKAADAAIAYQGRGVDEVLDVASTMTWLGRKQKDRKIMVPYLERAITVSKDSKDEDVLKTRQRLMVPYALYVEGDEAKAVTLRKEAMGEGWDRDAKKINGFAWWCFESGVNLEEAEKLADQAVDLAADDKTKAAALDTLAELCNLRNNCQDAVRYMELAVAADPKSEEYPKKLEQFRKNLANR